MSDQIPSHAAVDESVDAALSSDGEEGILLGASPDVRGGREAEHARCCWRKVFAWQAVLLVLPVSLLLGGLWAWLSYLSTTVPFSGDPTSYASFTHAPSATKDGLLFPQTTPLSEVHVAMHNMSDSVSSCPLHLLLRARAVRPSEPEIYCFQSHPPPVPWHHLWLEAAARTESFTAHLQLLSAGNNEAAADSLRQELSNWRVGKDGQWQLRYQSPASGLFQLVIIEHLLDGSERRFFAANQTLTAESDLRATSKENFDRQFECAALRDVYQPVIRNAFQRYARKEFAFSGAAFDAHRRNEKSDRETHLQISTPEESGKQRVFTGGPTSSFMIEQPSSFLTMLSRRVVLPAVELLLVHSDGKAAITEDIAPTFYYSGFATLHEPMFINSHLVKHIKDGSSMQYAVRCLHTCPADRAHELYWRGRYNALTMSDISDQPGSYVAQVRFLPALKVHEILVQREALRQHDSAAADAADAAVPPMALSVHLVVTHLDGDLGAAVRQANKAATGCVVAGDGAYTDPHCPVHTSDAHPDEQWRARYQLLVDGYAAPWRFHELLLSGVLCIRVESPWEEWWHQLLAPGVHFLRVRSDLSDLDDTLDWISTHVEEAMQIAAQGQQLMASIFHPQLPLCYISDILHQYAGVFPQLVGRQPEKVQFTNDIDASW